MGPGQPRLLIWTVPTIAILLSLVWYKRKCGNRGEPGGTKVTPLDPCPVPEAKEEVIEKTEVAKPTASPSRSPYSRSLSGVESTPIDIKTNRSTPLVVSDQELDMEIEKIKSMKNNNPVPSSSGSNSAPRTEDSANHSPAEAMLVSPSCSISSAVDHSDSDSGKGGSDVATPPPPNTVTQPVVSISQAARIVVHEFVIPQQLVGRLIGRHGAFVHQIKDKTNAHILIKRHPENIKAVKVCSVEGSRQEVDAALDMIRDKFPEKRYPEVTLEHANFPDSTSGLPLAPDCMHLKLVEGVNNDTIVSCMVTPRHLFLQQPTHPTFPSLNVLTAYMNACYSEDRSERIDTLPPPLPSPVQECTVCAARSLGAWYRAMVVSSTSEECCVRFLDYGGYATLEPSALRQIRGDFLLLPFQAAECLLAGVQPVIGEDGAEIWTQEAYDAVADLTKGAVVCTQVVDYMDDCTPLVNIYVRDPDHQVVFLNKELARRGLATFQES